jgi:phosphatidate cytidylyltransferase
MTAKKKIDSSLKLRVKSALIFGPAVLLILWFGGIPFTLMMTAGAMVGAFEWARMVTTGTRPPRQLTFVSALATGLAVLIGGLNRNNAGFASNPITAFWCLFAFCFMVVAYNIARKGPKLQQLLFGIIYIGFSMAVMVWIRNGSADGLFHMLTLLFIVWASDICAYFTGKAIGGPKLAPKISPKKTWAGFIGSSLGAGAVAAAMALPEVTAYFGVHTLRDAGPAGYFVTGFVLGMFGQAGDLFVSIFKRHYGIKDTGTLIPGHGGILDRIDALLLVALVFGLLAMLAHGA